MTLRGLQHQRRGGAERPQSRRSLHRRDYALPTGVEFLILEGPAPTRRQQRCDRRRALCGESEQAATLVGNSPNDVFVAMTRPTWWCEAGSTTLVYSPSTTRCRPRRRPDPRGSATQVSETAMRRRRALCCQPEPGATLIGNTTMIASRSTTRPTPWSGCRQHRHVYPRELHAADQCGHAVAEGTASQAPATRCRRHAGRQRRRGQHPRGRQRADLLVVAGTAHVMTAAPAMTRSRSPSHGPREVTNFGIARTRCSSTRACLRTSPPRWRARAKSRQHGSHRRCEQRVTLDNVTRRASRRAISIRVTGMGLRGAGTDRSRPTARTRTAWSVAHLAQSGVRISLPLEIGSARHDGDVLPAPASNVIAALKRCRHYFHKCSMASHRRRRRKSHRKAGDTRPPLS